jgi:hypothetical protein
VVTLHHDAGMAEQLARTLIGAYADAADLGEGLAVAGGQRPAATECGTRSAGPLPPPESAEARPTALFTGGFDGTADEPHKYGARIAIEFGWNVVAWDGAGQRGMLVQHGKPIRPDSESVLTPAVDWAIQQTRSARLHVAVQGSVQRGGLAAGARRRAGDGGQPGSVPRQPARPRVLRQPDARTGTARGWPAGLARGGVLLASRGGRCQPALTRGPCDSFLRHLPATSSCDIAAGRCDITAAGGGRECFSSSGVH